MDSSAPEASPTSEARAGAEHLLRFPERAVAEQVAGTLTEEGFARVAVASAPPGVTDEEEPGWMVRVTDDRLPDASGGGAYEGLRERFATLATEHGGSYDEPGDPRPPVTARDGDHDGPSDAAASR